MLEELQKKNKAVKDNELTDYDGRIGVPAGVSNTGAPAAWLIEIQSRAAIKTTRAIRGLLYINDARNGSVHVVDVYLSISTAGIHVARVGGRRRRKVASNECS